MNCEKYRYFMDFGFWPLIIIMEQNLLYIYLNIPVLSVERKQVSQVCCSRVFPVGFANLLLRHQRSIKLYAKFLFLAWLIRHAQVEAFNSLTSRLDGTSSRYHKVKNTTAGTGKPFPRPILRTGSALQPACHYSLRKATKTLQFMVRCTNLGWHVPNQQQGQQQQQQPETDNNNIKMFVEQGSSL